MWFEVKFLAWKVIFALESMEEIKGGRLGEIEALYKQVLLFINYHETCYD